MPIAASIHAPPKFSPLQDVAVFEKPLPDPSLGGVLGQHGVIVWRSSYVVEWSRYSTMGWLYVVYFPVTKTYDAVEESRLSPTGQVAERDSYLGHDFEVSYDRVGCVDAMNGAFRTPGDFWNTFVFRRSDVQELVREIKLPNPPRGIAKYEFVVPRDVFLCRLYVEEVLGKEFGTMTWRQVRGPESKWLF